ncbi:hypothetical protein ACEPPZ_11200 [Paracoccus yeei]|uniref:hypothetical protein n=1 Tax=Paracoccus yeei TaxID=147645 RepID=UPI0037CFE414
MKTFAIALTTAALLVSAPTAFAQDAAVDECLNPGENQLLKDGCDALDRFMETFNSGDGAAWAATLHFPHARLAGGEVQVWETPEDYAATNDVAELATKQNWDHTDWTMRKLVQQGDDKLHFITQFTRFDADDKPIGTYDSLYIVTKKDGEWGTQFRSSYVGVIGQKTAF